VKRLSLLLSLLLSVGAAASLGTVSVSVSVQPPAGTPPPAGTRLTEDGGALQLQDKAGYRVVACATPAQCWLVGDGGGLLPWEFSQGQVDWAPNPTNQLTLNRLGFCQAFDVPADVPVQLVYYQAQSAQLTLADSGTNTPDAGCSVTIYLEGQQNR
jgi:hypothetical protein